MIRRERNKDNKKKEGLFVGREWLTSVSRSARSVRASGSLTDKRSSILLNNLSCI